MTGLARYFVKDMIVSGYGRVPINMSDITLSDETNYSFDAAGCEPPTVALGPGASYVGTAAFALKSYTVTAPVIGGHGTVSCTTPVSHRSNSVCTITPDAGYGLLALPDDGGDVMASASGDTYTILNVTANTPSRQASLPMRVRISTPAGRGSCHDTGEEECVEP